MKYATNEAIIFSFLFNWKDKFFSAMMGEYDFQFKKDSIYLMHVIKFFLSFGFQMFYLFLSLRVC